MDTSKKPHGFNTDEEWIAYEQGKEHQERLLIEFIENWNFSTNSRLSKVLFDKFNEVESHSVELLEILTHLRSLKYVKDTDGKTPYYLVEMPKAWNRADLIIKQIKSK